MFSSLWNFPGFLFITMLACCIWTWTSFWSYSFQEQLDKKKVLGESAEEVSFVSLFVTINGALNKYKDLPMWISLQSWGFILEKGRIPVGIFLLPADEKPLEMHKVG